MRNITRIELYLPQRFAEIYEFQEICKTIDIEFDLFLTQFAKMKRNIFVVDADNDGLARFEKMYNLNTDKSEDLEYRRVKILAYQNGEIPYTKISLKNKLDTILGIGNYSIKIEYGYISVLLELKIKHMKEELYKILDKWLPADMEIDISLKYNTHKVLSKFTHKQLSQYTHKQLREDVLIGG